MATTTVSVPRGTTWTSLGTAPCSVYNPGPGAILIDVDTSLPGVGTTVGVPLEAGKTADIGYTGQNAYALCVDTGIGNSSAISVTVVR